MAESIKNVVLIGAGGNLGPSILKEFLNSSFKITVFSRQNSTSTFPSGVNVVKTDYTPADLEQKFKGQDAVISIVGNAGFGEQQRVIDAAVKAGVKRFIPSEYGCNTADDRVREICPIFNAKKAVVDYLKSKESDGISWTALITGPFFDWGLKVGFLGFNLKDQTAKIWDGGNTPFSTSNLPQIGKALVAILTPERLAETKNKYVFIDSYTVTQNEILAALEKVTRKKWPVVEQINSKEVVPANLEKLGKGDFSSIPGLILSAVYGPEALTDSRKLGLWNEKLGLPKENLEADVKAAVA